MLHVVHSKYVELKQVDLRFMSLLIDPAARLKLQPVNRMNKCRHLERMCLLCSPETSSCLLFRSEVVVDKYLVLTL